MKKLLIPIDFSKNSMNAVSFALKISEGKKHQLTFYTVSYHAKPKGAAAKGFLALQEDARKSDELELKKVVTELMAKDNLMLGESKLKFVAETGIISEDYIHSYSVKMKADLIVMGTKGSTGLKKVLFGSHAYRVLKNSKIPVLVVPAKPTVTATPDIIYSTDMQNWSKEIKQVQAMQKIFGGGLEMLFIRYPWAFDKKEEKEYEKAKAGKIIFHEKKVSLDKKMIDVMKSFMKVRPNAIVCMFHKEKELLGKILLGSNTKDFTGEVKLPLLSLKK